MYIPDPNNKQFDNMNAISIVNYGDIKEGDLVKVLEFVQAPKGYCSFYKTTIDGSKIHYLYTAEVTLEST